MTDFFGDGYRDESNQSNISEIIVDAKNHVHSFNIDVGGFTKRMEAMKVKESITKDNKPPKLPPKTIQGCNPTDKSVFFVYKNEILARFKDQQHIRSNYDPMDIFSALQNEQSKSDINWFTSLNLISVDDYKTSFELFDKLHFSGFADEFFDYETQGVISYGNGKSKYHPATQIRGLGFARMKIVNTIFSPLRLKANGEYFLDKEGVPILPHGISSVPGMLLKPRIWYYNTTVTDSVSQHLKGYYDPTTPQWAAYNRGTLPVCLQQTKKVGIYFEPVEPFKAKKARILAKKLIDSGAYANYYNTLTLDEIKDMAMDAAVVKTNERNYAVFKCTTATEFGKEMEGISLL